MAYCPKCKTEYEDHVEECVDCLVPLVDNLEDSVYMKPLIAVKKADLDEMLKYLEYSGISPVETEEQDNGIMILVDQEQYEDAVAYVRVYVNEHMDDTSEEDYYFDEYEVEIVDTENKVADMRSTVYTFGFIGVACVAVAVLNYVDVIKLAGFNKMMLLVVLGVLGLVFIGIAVKTASGISGASEVGKEKERLIEEIFKWYTTSHDMTSFYHSHKIKTNDVDEGALYFYVFDILKKEVSRQYPDAPDSIVNAAVERVYDEIG